MDHRRTMVRSMVFPAVMYGCDSWTIKKFEHQRTDAFELWYWRRLLREPCAARSNQSILKEISPEYSLEGLLRQKLKYFGHWSKSWFIGKDPDSGKDWRQEEKGTTEDKMAQWHCQLNGYAFQQALGNGEGQGGLACCSSRSPKEWDMTESLNNKTKQGKSICKTIRKCFSKSLC